MQVSNNTQGYSRSHIANEEVSRTDPRKIMTERFYLSDQILEENSDHFDDDEEDKQLEREAIELIKFQQSKIEEYEEKIAEFKCVEYQIDVYKQQITNLQSQVHVLEEKIRLSTVDSDTSKIYELETRIMRALEREKAMNNEIMTKEQEIKYMAEKIEEKNKLIGEFRK